jgi:hypothetical protein
VSISILRSSATPFRTTMQRRASLTWEAIIAINDRVEVEQIGRHGIRALEHHLRRFAALNAEANFSIVFDEAEALATVQKVAKPFRHPVTGAAVRIRICLGGSTSLNAETAAEWLATVTGQFVQQAAHASVGEILGAAFSAFVLRERRELAIAGMDADDAKAVTSELYQTTQETLVQRVINRLTCVVPVGSFESLGEAA